MHARRIRMPQPSRTIRVLPHGLGSETARHHGAGNDFANPLVRYAVSGRPETFVLQALESDMAVPKKKISPSRKGMRQSADALKAPTYVEDKESGEPRRPHHLDLKTGKYRGRQILNPREDV